MPSITVTQTQVDGQNNDSLNPALAAKRYDSSSYTTGLITGRFSVNNDVLTQGRLFKADGSEYGSAAPPVTFKGGVQGTTNVTLDNSNTGVEVGDIILLGCFNYYAGNANYEVPATSGFTTIISAGYTNYFRYRWSYRIATSSDTSGSRYVSTGASINTMAVFKIIGTNTPVKQNHAHSQYNTSLVGPIAVSNTNNGAVLAMGMSLANYDLTLQEYSDALGTRRLVADLEGLWKQDTLGGGNVVVGYRGVDQNESVANQSAELDNSSFRSQLIVHFTRTQDFNMDQAELEDIKRVLRDIRNTQLKETDLWGLSDYPASQAQIDYRQDLRDITDQAGFPTDITWPTKPE